jgi:hypothetical protein
MEVNGKSTSHYYVRTRAGMLLDLATKLVTDVHGKTDRRFRRASRQRRAIFFSSLQGPSICRSDPPCLPPLQMTSSAISPINCFAPVDSCYFWAKGRTKFSAA